MNMQFEIKKNSNGFLIPLEMDKVPFDIKRAFFVQNLKPGDIRGNHAHKGEEHFLICLNGSINVTKEDINGTSKFTLETGSSYYQKELEWLVLEYTQPNTSLLVFADALYDEANYIRDYEQFKKIIRKH